MSRGRGAAAETPQASFLTWQQQGANADLLSTAEKLLEQLEDVSELLTEIDQKYILSSKDEPADGHKLSMIHRFHGGLDCARELISVLQREKWRLSKRQMSVEIRIGELDEYKKHLKSDMSSLNLTVDALSMRVVQLENQLVEAQETQENLEAELKEHRNSLQDSNDRNIQLYSENQDLRRAVKELSRATVKKELELLRDEVAVLQDENRKLKDMLRDAEALASPLALRRAAASVSSTSTSTTSSFPLSSSISCPSPSSHSSSSPASPRTAGFSRSLSAADKDKEDNLMKLTKEFLDDLTSLELRSEEEEEKEARMLTRRITNAAGGGDDGGGEPLASTPRSSSSRSLSSAASSSSNTSVSSVTIDVKAEYV